MPLKRRTDKSRHLDGHKREQLLFGPDAPLLAGIGYLEPAAAATADQLNPAERLKMLAEMRRDWLLHRPQLLAEQPEGFRAWADEHL